MKIVKQFMRYGLVALVSYVFLFFGTFLLVNYVNLSKSLAYFCAISVVYVIIYFVYTKFVFTVDFSRLQLLRYALSLVVFWAVNNLFFNFLVLVFHLDYLLAMLFNLFFLGIFRFSVHHFLVFKQTNV